jgi:hypothetical protein
MIIHNASIDFILSEYYKRFHIPVLRGILLKIIAMKSHLTLSFLFVTACVIYSCSKNDNPTTGAELQQVKTTFSNITYYYTYERDASNKIISATDSTKILITTHRFEYGTNGKVSKVNFRENGGAIVSSYEFEYNSDGTIRKRLIKPGTSVVDDYNTYAYDAAGHLTADSLFSRGSTSVYKLIAVSQFQYTGDNATAADYYEVVSGTPQLKSSLKYEYDNGLNPYKDIEFDYFYNEAGSAIYTIVNKSTNNIVKVFAAPGNGSYVLNQTYSYQYNSNNYPLHLQSDLTVGTAKHFEVDYSYK